MNQLPPAVPPVIKQLQAVKLQLLTALKAVDVALAQAGGGDLVSWAGDAQYEQRCPRCGLWIFLHDKVCAVMIDEERSIYVHRECIVRPANAEEGRLHDS